MTASSSTLDASLLRMTAVSQPFFAMHTPFGDSPSGSHAQESNFARFGQYSSSSHLWRGRIHRSGQKTLVQRADSGDVGYTYHAAWGVSAANVGLRCPSVSTTGQCDYMFRKISKDDQLIKAAQKQKDIIQRIAQLQLIRLSIIGGRSDLPDGLRKVVCYLYFDTLAMVFANQVAGEPNDVLKGYLRDSALGVMEAVEPQFRSHAADAVSWKDAESKTIYPAELLKFLQDRPVFDAVLQAKVEAKIVEAIDLLAENNARSLQSHLSDLILDVEVNKSLQDPIDVEFVQCGGCLVKEEINDINSREDAKLYLFKTGERRTGDELEIFSCVCFVCSSVTELSFDPYNFSDNAIDGIEYFRTYPIDQNSFERILRIMKDSGHQTALLNLIASNSERFAKHSDL